MIEFVNKEDAQGPGVMVMARDIKQICMQIEYGECPSECECYDGVYGGCKLAGNDPSDWDLGEMP